MGRHDQRPPLTRRRVPLDAGQDGGHKIGEALADSRSRFDNQMRLVGDGLGHGFRHLQLLGPKLVLLQVFGDLATVVEDSECIEHARLRPFHYGVGPRQDTCRRSAHGRGKTPRRW